MADNPKISQVQLLPDNQLYDIADSEARQDIQDVSDELDTHEADTVKHITAIERTFWNNKVTCYIDPQDDENLVFDFEGGGGNPFTSITATFVQGDNIIYESDILDDLKQYLTIVGTHQDTTTETITTYTLSGTLTAGTSVITATYEGLTDTFNVTVTADPVIEYLYDWDLTESLTDKVQGAPITIEGNNAHFVAGTGIVVDGLDYVINIAQGNNIYEIGRIYEVDIVSADYQSSATGHGRFIMTSSEDGFIYRASQPRRWETYLNGGGQWLPFTTTSENPNIFSGKTIKVIPMSYGLMNIYADDELVYSGGNMLLYTKQNDNLYIGSSYFSSQGTFYNMVISGIRVYNNPDSTSKYICNYDLTQSLYSKIISSHQIICNDIYEEGVGIHISKSSGYCYTNESYLGVGKTIEIDISSMHKTYSSGHGRFIMRDSESGFIYRSSGQWEVYNAGWKSFTKTSSDPNIFDNTTIKIVINALDDMQVYANDVLVYSGYSIAQSNGYNSKLYLGSSGGQSAYDFTVSGLRIYYNNN